MHKTLLATAFVFIGVFAVFGQEKAASEFIIKLKTHGSYSDLMHARFVSEQLKKKNILSIEPVFPLATSPSKAKNEQGQPLIDLTRYLRCNMVSKHKDVMIRSIQKLQFVDYVEKVQYQHLLFTPDDPLNLSNQYYLSKTQTYEAWDIHKGDTSTTIGITDTGIDPGHEDLIYNIAYNWDDPLDGIDNDNDGYVDNFRGWDIGDDDNNPQTDYSNHGIYVSGIAAADTDNGTGISGTGFNCRILPVKISDSDSLITRGYEGIVYAANQGASVINCSWGNHHYSQFEQDMINYAAINKDVLVVAACGNDNNMQNFYPASYDNVLSVAGTTSEDEKWTPENTGTSGGSSYGYHVDISAPGTMMHTTDIGGTYRTVYAGTSFASPVVSGIAGLIRSYWPGLSSNQTIERLKNTTDNIDTIPYNFEYAGLLGTGRVNAYLALTEPFQPGVQFRNINISDDRDNNYENSLMVEITGEFYNYLASAQNLQVEISCENEHIDLLTTNISVGQLDSLQAFPVFSDPIQLEILPGASADEHVVLTLNIADGDWHRTQYVEFYVFPSWKVLNNDDMQLTIPGNGRLGFSDLSRQNGMGFNYSDTRDLFYDAGLMAGKSPDVFFDGIRSINHFTAEEIPIYINYQNSKESIQSIFFSEDPENSVNLEILQTSIAPENNDNLIILKYDFINHNLSSVDNWYAGLFFDWDLIKPTRNRIMYDSVRQFGYAFHTGDNNLHTGVKLLSEQVSHHYAIDQRTEESLINLSDGFSDEEKFYTLSNDKSSAGLDNQGSDVVQIVSAGNFNIPPEDTTTVCFAIMAGNGMLDIIQAADSAETFYQNHIKESGITQQHTGGMYLFPNPAIGNFVVQLPKNTSKANLTVFSITGQCLLKKELTGNTTRIEPGLAPGQYIIHVDAHKQIFRTKLIIVDAD